MPAYKRPIATGCERIHKNFSHSGRKYEVLKHYGGENAPRCKQCGWDNLDDLTLDHTNDDGREHRRQLIALGCSPQAVSGGAFYQILISMGFPHDFELQVLCKKCHDMKPKPCQKDEDELIQLSMIAPDFNEDDPIIAQPQPLWEEI